mmetsp:Transcript_111317/g.314238  ORF Transcript_111317/g.314238 Transcript_111317/m.314238 type:complete len:89 (-) Transcript_111317:9-275(-)
MKQRTRCRRAVAGPNAIPARTRLADLVFACVGQMSSARIAGMPQRLGTMEIVDRPARMLISALTDADASLHIASSVAWEQHAFLADAL